MEDGMVGFILGMTYALFEIASVVTIVWIKQNKNNKGD